MMAATTAEKSWLYIMMLDVYYRHSQGQTFAADRRESRTLSLEFDRCGRFAGYCPFCQPEHRYIVVPKPSET